MDGQGVGCESSAGNVEYSWQMLCRNFVNVWYHEKQSLRRSVRGGKGAIEEGSMHGTSGASLVVHFVHSHDLAEGIDARQSCPSIDQLSNGAGRCDGVDDSVVRKVVGDVRRSGTTVDRRHGHFQIRSGVE